jgi:hypothetical protein
MRRSKYTKVTIFAVSIVTILLILSPTVFAGSFQLFIEPYEGTIKPGIERVQVKGFHRNTPGPTDIFKGLFFAQFTHIEVKSKPDWATVIIPEADILTPLDDVQYNFSIWLSVSEEAPAYQDATISLSITTGKFIRNVIKFGPFAQEYPMDSDIAIKSGYLPLLTPSTPVPKEGTPNSEIFHMITLKNSGNARSIIHFSVNNNDIPKGWSVQAPAPIYLNPGESSDVPLTILTPRDFGYIDEWATIPLNVEIMSALEGSDGRTQNYTIPTTSHCVGYFVPGVPGGNNPGIMFGMLIAIVIVIIAVIYFVVKGFKGFSLKGKINLNRKKDKK